MTEFTHPQFTANDERVILPLESVVLEQETAGHGLPFRNVAEVVVAPRLPTASVIPYQARKDLTVEDLFAFNSRQIVCARVTVWSIPFDRAHLDMRDGLLQELSPHGGHIVGYPVPRLVQSIGLRQRANDVAQLACVNDSYPAHVVVLSKKNSGYL
jgi:hypothetical protein